MELDTNGRIIQLVQTRPGLYSKCNDFRGRADLWKEVADLLKAEVSWVKSRWHLLRTRFLIEYSSELKGKRTGFKYFHQMSFLVNHININAFEMHSKQNESKDQPEFVITKNYLDDASDDDSSNIFMEVELDDGVNKDLIQIPQSYEISEDELDEAMYLASDEFPQQRQHLIKTQKFELGSHGETFQIVEVREKEDSDTATVLVKDNISIEESNRIENSSSGLQPSSKIEQEELCPEMPRPLVEDFEAHKLYSVKTEKHRCEDAIFGELVSATLRKMQTEKKKAVKREIMNILFA